jgi:lipopolysaccharide/colanic/teichoic acid biosynthesis glycosyltransferase
VRQVEAAVEGDYADGDYAGSKGHGAGARLAEGSDFPRGKSLSDSIPARCGEALPQVRPMEALFTQPLPCWKRCLDIVGATVGLVLAAPILLIAAALIKLSSPGPALFTQRRAGLGGKPFTLYKLRTMYVDAEARKAAMRQYSEQDGPAFKMTNDPRTTRLGRFLRSTSLDEIPQLLNVLRGDMSLVGPRPLPCDESAACRPWQRERLDVTPGLTCIWQVSGRSSVSFNQWMRMDLAYVRSRTLLLDLKLIFLTIPAVLFQRGAH